MFYDSEHEFSDYIIEVEEIIKVVTNKINTMQIDPDEKVDMANLCVKVKDMIPYEYSLMKTQIVLKQHHFEIAEFICNFTKLNKFLSILIDFTSVRLESKSMQQILYWKNLAEEGNEDARVVYKKMKREFPGIIKQIESGLSKN